MLYDSSSGMMKSMEDIRVILGLDEKISNLGENRRRKIGMRGSRPPNIALIVKPASKYF